MRNNNNKAVLPVLTLSVVFVLMLTTFFLLCSCREEPAQQSGITAKRRSVL